MKNRRRCVAVAAVLSIVLVWSLASSENSGIESGERDASFAGQDYAEVFSAGDSNSGIVFINFQEPQATNDFSREAWFLGAYRFADGSLIVELSAEGGSTSGGERGSLTNNLHYALSYAAGAESVLYLKLLHTNGVVLAESDNLLTSSNVDHYVFLVSDAGNVATNTVLLVNVPTAEYPEVAVMQLVAAEGGSGPVVGPALLYIDEDADGWTATDEIRNGTSDYIFDASGGVISNYSDWVNGNNGGSSTNNSGGGSGGSGNGSGEEDDGQQSSGTVWVDQALGNDSFSGFSPVISGRGQGPKKTVGAGVAVVGRAETLVIKSGDYGENLKISGKDIKVVIEGAVKL